MDTDHTQTTSMVLIILGLQCSFLENTVIGVHWYKCDVKCIHVYIVNHVMWRYCSKYNANLFVQITITKESI